MPRLTNAKTAPILDEADRFLRQLRWMEFQVENTFNNYEGPGWYPGRPLHRMPRGADYHEQTVRQMIEVFDDDDIFNWLRCKDCHVYWSGYDGCWMCGYEDGLYRSEYFSSNFHTDGDPEYDESGLPTVERVKQDKEKRWWADEYRSPHLDNTLSIPDNVRFDASFLSNWLEAFANQMFFDQIDLSPRSRVVGAATTSLVRVVDDEGHTHTLEVPNVIPTTAPIDLSEVVVRNLHRPPIDPNLLVRPTPLRPLTEQRRRYADRNHRNF